MTLTVGNVHCAGCIARIERTLRAEAGVTGARVNLGTRRLSLEWRAGETDPRKLMGIVAALGYPVAPFEAESADSPAHVAEKELLRSLAVAGFAAGNVMLLSVAVWAGAFSDMEAATRDLFHWLSALIALPAVVYAGQPFYAGAWRALRAGAMSMDVPISVGVILASAMSLFETVRGGEHAYFDAAVTLLFFLLVGRYLDLRARAQARSTAENLLALGKTAAMVLEADGSRRSVPAADLFPGMRVLVMPGDRVPADGVLEDGTTEVDTSLVTGETLPVKVTVGDRLFAGTLNLTTPARVTVTAAGKDTLLAEIVRLMETAEQGRARYVRLADRVSRLYAPMVHILAVLAFAGWVLVGGLAWQEALLIAVAVLIITCPCALGLAVPVTQVVASGLLLRRGIVVKSSDGLERLAGVDTIVFDKTGTLTLGRPELAANDVPEEDLKLAVSLACLSRHPLSRALTRAAGRLSVPAAHDVREVPGYGLEGRVGGGILRLGNRDWCGVAGERAVDGGEGPELWFSRMGCPPRRFVFVDPPRPDAAATVERLKSAGYRIELLSGDRAPTVARVAASVGIDEWRAACLPADKVARLTELARDGRKVAMVGDGLNDAPALAAGFVSLSPASAADISQTAADLIFQGDGLAPVATAFATARATGRVVRQNLTLAILYNLLAVPIAMAGLATPLVAAVAMSSSSLLVTVNALLLRLRIRTSG